MKDAPHYSAMNSPENDNGFHGRMKSSAAEIMARVEAGELVIIPAKLTPAQHKAALMNVFGDPFRADDRFYRSVVELFKVTLGVALLLCSLSTPAHAAKRCPNRAPGGVCIGTKSPPHQHYSKKIVRLNRHAR